MAKVILITLLAAVGVVGVFSFTLPTIDPCEVANTCKHGKCEARGKIAYCRCEPGYSGMDCDDDCNKYCSNWMGEAKCANDKVKFPANRPQCSCKDGSKLLSYSPYDPEAKFCVPENNECFTNSTICKSHERCYAQFTDFTPQCACQKGTYGDNCSLNCKDLCNNQPNTYCRTPDHGPATCECTNDYFPAGGLDQVAKYGCKHISYFLGED